MHKKTSLIVDIKIINKMQAEKIYFDNNATTALHPDVKIAMDKTLGNIPLNPSSVHYYGQMAANIVRDSRAEILKIALRDQAKDYDLIFTSSGSESNNQIMKTFENDLICTSELEHPSVLKSIKNSIFIKNNQNGEIDFDNLEETIASKNPKLVSIMQANNEIGVVNDIKIAADLCKKHGVLFHTDASQSFGKIDTKFDEILPDYITLSSHKIYGPIGVSALIFRKNKPIIPLLLGGQQEFNHRAGTQNIPAIFGFAEACKLTALAIELYRENEKFQRQIEEAAELNGFIVAGKSATRLPNTSLLLHSEKNTSAELMKLDFLGFMASGGSACSWGLSQKSKMPELLGYRGINCTLRISSGIFNQAGDFDGLRRGYFNHQ